MFNFCPLRSVTDRKASWLTVRTQVEFCVRVRSLRTAKGYPLRSVKDRQRQFLCATQAKMHVCHLFEILSIQVGLDTSLYTWSDPISPPTPVMILFKPPQL
ncbi:hypothetical protein Hanom_Chr09g00849311 [Helianthus anomalus]